MLWNETNQSSWAFQWNIDGGDLMLNYTLSTQYNQFNCVPNDVDCFVFAEYRMVPLMRIGARVYWLFVTRVGYPMSDSAPIYWSQVSFADYEPLGG